MRDDRERLLDLVEAIERIEKYSSDGRGEFEENEPIQTWIVHHLQLIGEAVRALSDETRSLSDAIDWSKVIGMRNILVHSYFSIDPEIVWAVIENDLDDLKDATEFLLAKVSTD